MKQITSLWLLMFFFASTALFAQTASTGNPAMDQLKIEQAQSRADIQPGVVPGVNQTNGKHYSKFQGPNGTRDVLYDNGPFVTAEGVGSNGTDYSELQDASLGMGTYGAGVQLSATNSLADDFEVTGTWILTGITVYGYQTNSGPPSTLTGVYMQIWDGNPTDGGSVIWGDLTTNVMTTTEWTNAWRVLESGPSENRPIMAATADLGNLALNAGTYWIEYSLDGSGASGPWNPPVTIVGETTTGNGLQNQAGLWVELLDVGPQGVPFVVEGFTGTQPANDVSVSAIIEPMTGVELGAAEPVVITIKNNGTDSQSSIPYEVTWDGPTGAQTVSGTFTGTLATGETADVTLAETADLSSFGDYDFEACTMLAGDEYPDNDCKTKMVSNLEPSLCVDGLYSSGCGFGDGLISWNFANIDIPEIPCAGEPPWYHDYRDQVHELTAGETYTLTIVAGYTQTNVDVWVDLNDDLLLTDDELILDDAACAEGNVPYTFEITIPEGLSGEHVVRYRTNWIDVVLDACETYSYGNACDFTANISGGVTGPAISVNPAELMETHDTPPQVTTQTLTVTNTGNEPLNWDLVLETGAKTQGSLDVEKYTQQVEARQAVEGQPTADVRYGVTPGENVTNGNHYSKFQGPNGTRDVLYDNGPFVTAEGVGSNGTDYSELQDASLGMGTYGAGVQLSATNSLADDFEVTGTWILTGITVYGYQTNSGPPSTLTGVYMQIWDGNPTDGGSVIWGDLTTNVMTTTEWTNAWRVLESGPSENRPIMAATADLGNLALNAGTYWIEYSLDGSGASGPWNPPVTIVGETTTGNALQNQSGTWVELLDVGPQGVPFVVEGFTGTQPANDVSVSAIIEPMTGVDLTAAEPITITLKNNGTDAQSSIPWEVSYDGPTGMGTFSGTWTGSLASGATEDVTLAETADLSAYGDYDFEACTQLAGDEYPDNDCKTKMVSNLEPSLCVDGLYSSGCGFGDGLISWNFANIDIPEIPCAGEPPWYHDYRDQVHELTAGETYTLTIVAGYTQTNVDVWVDLNDDLLLTDDELILDDAACAEGNVPYTFEITIPEGLSGEHVVRYRTNWIDVVLDACETYSYGNACDFTANITGGGGQDEWVEVDVTGGTLDAGASQDITATFNSNGYENGTYEGMITINSNDPNNATVEVPVSLTVGGTPPVAFEEETFEDYNAGDYLMQQAVAQGKTYWSTWSAAPGSAEDPFVTDQAAFEGSNSVVIEGTNDAVLYLNDDGGFTEGVYLIDFYVYIPTGKVGYFNALQLFDGTNSEWGMQAYFDVDGAGLVDAGAAGAGTFTYTYDTWHNVQLMIDLDTDYAEMHLNGETIVSWVWSSGSFGSGTRNELHAMNFYAWAETGTPGAHFDNISITDGFNPPTFSPPTDFTAAFVEGNGVETTWVDPAEMGTWVGYDDGTNDDGLGLNGGGTFWGAIRWEPADLAPFDGQYMTKFKFFPRLFATEADFTFMIFEGADAGTLVYEQELSGLTWDEWNTITLDDMHMIDASQELWIGMEVVHEDGEFPFGIDAGPAQAGYGDMVSFDGTTWESLSSVYSIDNNFNLKAFVAEGVDGVLVEKQALTMPSISNPNNSIAAGNLKPAGNPADVRAEFQGVNIYRDGSLVNAEPVAPGTQAYTDAFFENGTYMYAATAVYDEGESDPTPAVEVEINLAGGPEISVTPESLSETHVVPPAQQTTQELYITNTGTETLDWEITLDLGRGAKSDRTPMDPAEYQQLLNERMATEGVALPSTGLAPKGSYEALTGGTGNPLNTRETFYAYNAYDPSGALAEGPAYFDGETPGTVTLLAPTTSGEFIAGGTWAADTWWGAMYTGGLYTIDNETGDMTFVGNSPDCSGLAFDGETVYGASITDLYTIDPATGQGTLVGPLGTSGGLMIAIACDANGDLYGFDIGDDTFYSIDKGTGAATAIGVMGPNFNYAQDMAFDKDNDVCYLAGYTSAGGLYTVDVATGAATLVGEFQGGAEMTAMAIPYAGITYDNDISLSSIVSPVTGVELSGAEDVIIKIKNNGTVAQSGFDWEVTWDGPTGPGSYSGVYSETLAAGETVEANVGTADLSAFGDYVFDACVTLAGDENPDNDCKTKTVSNLEPSLCVDGLYSSGCSFGDGLISWNFANVDVPDIPCSGTPEWYHDYRDMTHEFNAGETYTLTVVAGYTQTNVDVWIDWNDDLLLTDDELILNDAACAEGNVPYTFEVTIPMEATPGDHVLRFRTNWIDVVLDACETYSYGNCCDFTANAGGGTPSEWLSVDMMSGSVEPGDTQTVMAMFDSEGLELGLYEGDIMVNSNAVTNPSVDVPSTLTVTNAGPEISVTPESMFETHVVPPAQQTSQELMITNTGTETLDWEITLDLGTDSPSVAMDSEEYAKLLAERQAAEGQPTNDVQYGVTPGVEQTNGNHYSKFQGPNGTRDVLYDNGGFITAEGVGSNGSDYSELQDASLGMGTYGAGVQLSAGNSLADEFEVTGTWIVNSITVFGYQTGSGPPSTLTGVYMQIWDGNPTAGGSVIWGDLTTNIMESTEWTNVWRVLESGPTENRPIMQAVADLGGLALNAGTYWIEYSLDGSGASGPWNPPVTIVGETTTGNGLQNQSGLWVDLLDVGPQGVPFIVEGFTGSQPDNDVSVSAIIEPMSGVELGSAEPITITLKNNGLNAQTSIPWEVTYDGPTGMESFSGTWTGSLASGETIDVTLTETADLSSFGDYDFEACTMLAGDEYPDNDCKTKMVTNLAPSLCVDGLYSSGCGFGDGLISWNFADVDVADIPCSGTPEWYHDYRDMTHNFNAGETYTLTVVAGYTQTNVDVWIDWNDDLLLTDDELILDDAACAEANVPYTFEVTIPMEATGGDHVLRFRTNWIDVVLDACETYSYGNCCDFTANAEGGSGGGDWLSVDVMSGSVEPGGTATVNVMFDSDGLELGTYDGMAMVTSNATNTPTVEVSCTLEVTDVALPVAIDVNPESLTETHTIPPAQMTTQEVTITNTGDTDVLDWEIAIDLGTSPSVAMDAEEYARLLEERQAMEGQPTNDVQYGVTPGYNVTGGNHYSKFQGTNGTRDVLYDNGGFITAEGVGSNGSDYSELQDASLGMGTYGAGVQLSAGNSLADEFEVTGTWIVNSITVFGYQTGSGPPSTLTGVYMQIWDGNPTAGGSVIWGDLTTNIMESTEWTNVWRVLESGPTENRPIMQAVADLGGLALNAGTYWIEYSLDGSGASGPWNPPVTIVGETTTGNGLQNQSGLWVDLLDVGPQGVPFIVEGFTGSQPDNDVSVSAIIEPMSGVELGSAEPITITLKNNGLNAQTSIPWEVTYDGPTGMESFSGTWTGSLASGETIDVTLTETADLSSFGDYDFEACTMLAGDEYPDNDCKTKMVTNLAPSLCVDGLYSSGCGFGDGLISWNFADVDVADIPCSGTPEWYHDYRDMTHNFNAGETYTLTVVAGYTQTNVDVWIDWNDDLLLTDDELILDDAACAEANVPYTFEVTIPMEATGGDHVLRFRTNWIDVVLDACETYSYGNCCDFTANAGGGTGGDDWLSVDMMSGSLNPGQSETVTVTFNSEELGAGVYNGALMITSNAVNTPSLDVPCTLTVEEEGGNQIVFEPFEDYNANDYLVQQAIAQGKEYWTTWSENPGSTEDPFVVDNEAYAGSNSMVIEGTNDAVLILPENYAEGKFDVSFQIYIPTGTVGYFNALQQFAGTTSQWGMQAYFDVGGVGTVDAGGAGAGTFTYTYDTWHFVYMMIDLDTDYAEMYVNGEMIVAWTWSGGSFGTGTLNEFHALNFYAWAETGTPGAHFDDIDISIDGGGSPVDPPTNLEAVVEAFDVFLTWEYGGFFEPEWITYSGTEITNSIGTNAAANFDCAARWEPGDLAGYENGAVTKINFVPGEPGDLCTYTLKVWQGAGNPTLIYEQELTEVVADVWNEVTLDTPVPFDNTQELWIGFNCNTTSGYPGGCDDGPQVEGYGNMMFWEGAWVTLSSLNPALIYNWAIQGYIEAAGDGVELLPVNQEPVIAQNSGTLDSRPFKMNPPAIFTPEETRVATFNVYRDDVQIANGVGSTSYDDLGLPEGIYVYYVTAVVDGDESDPSNTVQVQIVSIDEVEAGTFTIYPNPTNGLVNIKSDMNLKSVRLINFTGQIVYSRTVSGMDVQFNTGDLATGIYTLQLETEAGISVHKLIVQ